MKIITETGEFRIAIESVDRRVHGYSDSELIHEALEVTEYNVAGVHESGKIRVQARINERSVCETEKISIEEISDAVKALHDTVVKGIKNYVNYERD